MAISQDVSYHTRATLEVESVECRVEKSPPP